MFEQTLNITFHNKKIIFFSRPLLKAGRELQTELNTKKKNNGGMMITLGEKPAGGKCYSSRSTIILQVGNINSWQ